MSHISFPEAANPTAAKIRSIIKNEQFVILIEMVPGTDNIGFHYLLSDGATEDITQQAATISAMLAGIFLLPEEQFTQVLDLANHALGIEAAQNEELKAKLEQINSDEDEDEKPEYLN